MIKRLAALNTISIVAVIILLQSYFYVELVAQITRAIFILSIFSFAFSAADCLTKDWGLRFKVLMSFTVQLTVVQICLFSVR